MVKKKRGKKHFLKNSDVYFLYVFILIGFILVIFFYYKDLLVFYDTNIILSIFGIGFLFFILKKYFLFIFHLFLDNPFFSNLLNNDFSVTINGNLLAKLKKIGWVEFEIFIEKMYEKQGYEVFRGPGSKDGGVDLAFNDGGDLVAIQCKKWNKGKNIGVGEIREFLGVLTHNTGFARGVYITTTGLTVDALDVIKNNNIKLIDENNLAKMVREVFDENEIVNLKITNKEKELQKHIICKECGANMILRVARQGKNTGQKFYGCSNYSKGTCTYTEDIK